MIVSVHQPHFLPWLGYLNKAVRSDVFVWLHDVQYRKNYFQNRTKIRGENGEALWLTLPVHARLSSRIDEVTLADRAAPERLRRTVEQCYRKAPGFHECWPPIRDALAEETDSLEELDRRAFDAVLRLIGSPVRVVRVAELGVAATDPTDRLVAICRQLGASAYIAGRGGRNYLREESFAHAGIALVWQDFDPAALPYRQTGPGFVPGLSVLDCLLNLGAEETRRRIEEAWKPAA
ncbi:MAG TPA: WbqC family protein [Thermoanaerobaculia bacterium]